MTGSVPTPRHIGRPCAWITMLPGMLSIALLTQSAAAQPAIPEEPAAGLLAPGLDVARERALRDCSPLAGDFGYELEATPTTGRLSARCSVQRVDTLGAADGATFVAVTHLARMVFAADSITRRYEPGKEADTADVLEVVLYATRGAGGPWRAEWRGWVERAFTWDVTTAMRSLADGALFSFVSCVNGTGGCQQHFLVRRNGRWMAPRETYYEELTARFGRMFWKGIVVDVKTLRGTVALYSEEDGNCCPSRVLDLALRLAGDSIVVDTYRVRAAGTGRLHARPGMPGSCQAP